MTRAARLSIVLAAASCGGLLAASSVPAAPLAAVPEALASAPANPLDRLEQLDQLHADLELAKLRAEIAKADADARNAAAGPAVGAAGGPPMPQFGPGSAILNLPQLAPPGSAAGKGKDKGKADAPSFTLVEAWGGGADRQAVIRSDAGDRLVRVGDEIPLGLITAIAGGAVTYRDAKGQSHTID
jgi:hypothetical protein